MVWKLLGWLVVVGIVLGAVIVSFVAMNVGFTSPSGFIDWSRVRLQVAVPLWITDSLFWLVALIAAALPAPVGFFRRARGANARTPLLIYSIATLLVTLVTVASHAYVASLGAIQIGPNTFRSSGYDNALIMALVCLVLGSPVIGAVMAMRRPKLERRGFDVLVDGDSVGASDH